jgi:hypothetical protein
VAETLVAWTGAALPAGAPVVQRGDAHAAVWRLRDDPWLPGLRALFDRVEVRRLLDSVNAPRGPVRPRLRAYRPGSRAVVELEAGGVRLFAKLVRPAEVSRLQALHRLMAASLPVPTSHGWSEQHGLVLLEGLNGATLRSCLEGDGGLLPAPETIASLLARIPSPGGRLANSLESAALRHAELLRRLLPDLGPSLDRLSEVFSAADHSGEPSPFTPVHGDLHGGQLLVQGGRITGLLDIDTVAIGHPEDDWASLIAHICVLADGGGPTKRRRARAYAERVLAHADERVSDVALRRKVAAVTVALATGPFRVQAPGWPADTRARVAAAERWVAQAAHGDGRDEQSLTAASALSHAHD